MYTFSILNVLERIGIPLTSRSVGFDRRFKVTFPLALPFLLCRRPQAVKYKLGLFGRIAAVGALTKTFSIKKRKNESEEFDGDASF